MVDHEFLDVVAKAAGIKLQITGKGRTEMYWDVSDPSNHKLWNPVENDGDSFRLMVLMTQKYELRFVNLVAILIDDEDKSDLYASARRTIFRASYLTAIGKPNALVPGLGTTDEPVEIPYFLRKQNSIELETA